MPMRSVKYFLLTVSISLFPYTAWAQSYNNQQIELAEQLHSLSKKASPELAYIQTNKDIYETGEDLWFKVYLLDSQYLIPSLLSKTLYLQLLDESTKTAVWQEKYEVLDGFANGRVYIAGTLPEGDYLLTAYTPNSFFNDTCEFYAIRKIKVRTDITSRPSITAKFDKPFYNRNDTIRIKLSPVSVQRDSLYAEITATLKQGNKRMEKEQSITNGQGKTTIVFPPQVSGNGLQVTINIKYKDRTESLILPIATKSNPLQFTTFPEGGNMISGIQNKLAFKAVNIAGEPVDIKGTLYEDNTPLLEFRSSHAGMGSFGFIPVTGKKYIIHLSEPEVDSTFLLPEIYPEGITMHLVGRDKESLAFKVSQSPGLKQENIYIRVQMRGVVYGMTGAQLNGEVRIKIPLSELPQGIAEVTLFNSSLIPVAERLVYINQYRKLNITAELSREIYSTRGKAILKISVKDENGHPVEANLGVTVFDKRYQNSLDSNNILTHYYLSSQLKGRIYNPSFYFNSNSKDRDEALDLLLLTQGWRRYAWNEDNLSKNAMAQQVITDGIEGVVMTRKKMPVQKQSFVFAFSPNIDSTKVMIQADSIGRFSIEPEYFKRWQGEYIYMKPFSSSKVNIPIKLSDPFEIINSVGRSNEFIYAFPAINKEKPEISDTNIASNGVVRIKEVTIKGKKSNAVRGKYLGSLDSLARYNNSTDYVCRYNILNCRNHPNESDNKKPVLGKTYLIESGGAYLSVVYTGTQGQPLTEKQILKMYNLSRTKAYFNSREFYNPDYDKEKAENNLPDFRNTLLWEPSVITNEKGEASLSFFCSDIYSDFVGRIEGVGGDGLLGAGYFNFKVRKLNITP